MPQIAVEISAPYEAATDPGEARVQSENRVRELRRALLAACTDTAGVAECVDSDEAPAAVAVALVIWRRRSSVHIEVSSKRVQEGQWTERELQFSAADAAIERWRTAGYAVGTVAGELVKLESRQKRGLAASPAGETATSASGDTQRANSEEPPGREAEQAPSDPERDHGGGKDAGHAESPGKRDTVGAEAPIQIARRDHSANAADWKPPDDSTRLERLLWWAEAGALGGPGPYGSAPRFGAYARVSRVFQGPLLTASLGYAACSDDQRGLSAQWITASAGAGYAAFIGARFVLDLRAEIAVEHLSAFVDDTPSSRSDTAGRWMPAVRTGGEVAWAPFHYLAGFLGAEAMLRPAITDVIVRDERVGSVGSIDYSLLGGVRILLP